MGYIGNQPAETPVVEILETDFKIGEDDQTKIDFETANTINFYANNAKEVVLTENSLTPGTSDGTALGTTSLMWSDLFLASGSVINLNNGNVTITHSSNTLTVAAATVAFTASTAVTVSNDLKLSSDSAILSLGADDDATLTHDGTTGLTIAANPFEVDSGGNITLDAHTGIFIFQDANSEVLRITEGNSGDVTIKLETNAKDLIFTDNGDAEGFRISDAAAGVKVAGTLDLGHASDTTLARSAAGEVTIEGVAVKKVGVENMWIPAAAITPSETNGCASLTSVETSSGRPDLIVLDFDKDSDEFAHFSVAMPKSWNEGVITFQAYWTSASTNTGNVAWAMSGVSFGDNDLIDQDYGTTVVATAKAHSGTAEDLNISAESGNLTVANAAADELAFFEIFRDVSADNHSADARLLGVKIFYTTDTSTDA